MNLQGHLLYIDITQICGIGCAFCMYSDKHKLGMSMELSTLARENLSALINAADVKRISISGEGEPLNNAKVFHEILRLSEGGKCFEFITSGFLPHDNMVDFYETTNRIVVSNGDTCNIRLSADSNHIEKVKWRAHGLSCLVPERSGLWYEPLSEDDPWLKFFTNAPRPRTLSEQKYSDRKIRSRC